MGPEMVCFLPQNAYFFEFLWSISSPSNQFIFGQECFFFLLFAAWSVVNIDSGQSRKKTKSNLSFFYETRTSVWYASTFPFATFNCDLETFRSRIPIVARGEATEAKCFVSLYHRESAKNTRMTQSWTNFALKHKKGLNLSRKNIRRLVSGIKLSILVCHFHKLAHGSFALAPKLFPELLRENQREKKTRLYNPVPTRRHRKLVCVTPPGQARANDATHKILIWWGEKYKFICFYSISHRNLNN